MQRTVYLHVGAHKTGTTSLQHALGANEERLKQHGFLFPSAGRIHFTHRRLVFGLQGRRDHVVGDIPDANHEIRSIIADIEASKADKIILSSEALFVLRKSSIRFIFEHFKRFDTKVVAYIRRQDDMLLSLYNQRIKTTTNDFKASFAEVLSDPRNYIDDYRSQLDNWASVFGKENLLVRCYELAGDVVTDFQRLVGIPFPLIDPNRPMQRNRSVSVDGVHAFRWVKMLVRDERWRKRIRRILRKLPLRNDVSVLLKDEDRRRILELFKDDNDYVFRKYLKTENLYDPRLLAGGSSGSGAPHSAAIGAGATVRPAR